MGIERTWIDAKLLNDGRKEEMKYMRKHTIGAKKIAKLNLIQK